jgi:hypothetical protein
MTDGFDVFVQLVIAAMTTEPVVRGPGEAAAVVLAAAGCLLT